MTKLDIKDAAFHFLRAEGGSTDMYGIYAFDSVDGLPPTFDQVRAHVATRAPLVPALNIVLREAPFNLDFPSWVPGGGDTSAHLTDHDLTGSSWAECLQRISKIVETRLDARVRPWHLHVLRGVDEVPTVLGAATVVVLQVTHALTDGIGLTRISGALFAPPSGATTEIGALLPGHRAVDRPKSRLVSTAAALLTIPVRLASYGYRNRQARRRYASWLARHPATAVPGPATRLTANPTEARAVHIVPLPASSLRIAGVPVTVAALTAVGAATARYLREHGDPVPDTVNASVPVALDPDVEWPSSNRVLSGIVGLHPGVADASERARLVAQSLASERRRVRSPELIGLARVEELLPAPVVLAARAVRNRRSSSAPTMAMSHTNVVSVDRGRARPNLELCGSRVAFTSGTPMLTAGRSVVHGFFGAGEVITMVVLACPDTVTDHDRYVTLLLDAIRHLPADELETYSEV